MQHTKEFIAACAELYNLIRQIPNPEAIQFTTVIPPDRARMYLLLPDGSYAYSYRPSPQFK